MFTIKTIRRDTCDDCHASSNGLEFVLERDPGGRAFLCWKHFRMTLEAMRVASLLPEGGVESSQDVVDGDTETAHGAPRQSASPGYTQTIDDRSGNGESIRQNFMHGETKGQTDRRDTGGEG